MARYSRAVVAVQNIPYGSVSLWVTGSPRHLLVSHNFTSRYSSNNLKNLITKAHSNYNVNSNGLHFNNFLLPPTSGHDSYKRADNLEVLAHDLADRFIRFPFVGQLFDSNFVVLIAHISNTILFCLCFDLNKNFHSFILPHP